VGNWEIFARKHAQDLARHAGHDVYEESVVFDEHVIRETTPLTDEQVKDQTEIAGKIVEYDDMERSR
jgi:uncharacterized membrane protein YccC